ncbi:MAG: hypothetical protein JXR91_14725 [Deltaproteobacteria bacterium]|nr:hypothetical protein [Deltaproteobacteria bacterium]
MKTSTLIFLIIGFSFSVKTIKAEDLSYVTDEELNEDITARTNDVIHTSKLIDEMKTSLDNSILELSDDKEKLIKINSRLNKKSIILYKMSRNGKSVQYLISSDSAITFIKRVETLKKLVTVEIKNKKEAELKIFSKEEKIKELKESIIKNSTFLEKLNNNIAEMQKELQLRAENNRTPDSL